MLDMNGFALMAMEHHTTPEYEYFYDVGAKIYTLHYYCGGSFKLSDKSTIEDVRTFIRSNMLLGNFLTTVAVVYHRALQRDSWAKKYYGVEL